jgi:hypothetical protein
MKRTLLAPFILTCIFMLFARTAFGQCGGLTFQEYGGATMSADSTSIYVGQSTGIHADFTVIGGFYGGYNYGIFSPDPNTLVSAMYYGGEYSHADYTFAPSSPGAYTFYACAGYGGVWSSFDSITVNVMAADLPYVSASAGSIYPGQTATVSWNAGDVDGTFDHVDVYITQSGSPNMDYLGSAGASGSINWQSSANFNSWNPAVGSYYFVVRAWDSLGGSTDADAPFDVIERAPVTSISASATNLTFGQTATITATTTEADGNLISQSIDYLTPGSSSWVIGGATWSGAMTGSNTLTWTVPVSILNHPGTVPWQIRASGSDGYAVSNYPSVAITVAKATPAVSHWASRAIANNTGYAVTAADLTAVFSNPYSSTVAQPTGAAVYSIVSDSTGKFPAGTVITPTTKSVLQPANYTIQVSYPGDSNYNAIAVNVTWIISNPVTLNTASATNVFFGQTVTITSYSADKDNLLVSEDIDYLPPSATTWVTKALTWSGGPVGNHTLTWTIPTSILNKIGPWQVRGSGTNSLGFASPFLSVLSIPLAKATPAVSKWSNQTFPTTHIVTAADLSAAFANPYTSSIAQPTGAVTYSIVAGGSGPVIAGTKLYPGTYTIRASYPGDTNYNPLTANIVWTIINHPPVTLLTANVMDIAPGQAVTLTAATTDVDGNLISQTIDYLPPGSSTWVIGGDTWSGAMTGSHTLTWTMPASLLTTPGVWTIRATGGDGIAAPNYANLTVVAAYGITGPTGLKIYRPAQ